jgi:hypothetical protein
MALYLEPTRSLKIAKTVAHGLPKYSTTPDFTKSGMAPWLGQLGVTFLGIFAP